ncbi:hypothetical protein CPB86DRAFT_795346 [Serendipita vermifera]|nr:hypothetical protein CPB86DRAFT_795346 [Serendipita vermifera]
MSEATPYIRKRKRSPSTSQDVMTKRFRVADDSTARIPPPSSLAKPKYLRQLDPSRFTLHRPPTCDAIPLSLLHSIFAEFTTNVENHQPTPEDLCEGKAWKGEGDSEVRASSYVLYALRRELLNGKDPLDLLPCIIVYLVGSTFYFSGTVLTDRFQLETMALAPPLDTSFYLHSLDTKIARAFGAFRIAVAQLHRHYDDMSVANDNSNPTERLARAARLALPYPDSYTAEGKEVKLTYDYRLNDRKLMFIATTTEGTKVLVKFTERYSLEAHWLCAKANAAPALYRFQSLPGGWYMAVMEYLDPEIYQDLTSGYGNDASLKEEVNRVVTILHEGGFVHGDIRDVNIMTRRRWEPKDGARTALLLDFDWAGQDGVVTYPINVNVTSIRRPDEIRDWKPIKKEHDWFMVKQIFH